MTAVASDPTNDWGCSCKGSCCLPHSPTSPCPLPHLPPPPLLSGQAQAVLYAPGWRAEEPANTRAEVSDEEGGKSRWLQQGKNGGKRRRRETRGSETVWGRGCKGGHKRREAGGLRCYGVDVVEGHVQGGKQQGCKWWGEPGSRGQAAWSATSTCPPLLTPLLPALYSPKLAPLLLLSLLQQLGGGVANLRYLSNT